MLGFGKKKKDPKDPLDDFELPSFPTAILGLLAKLRNPDTAIDELAADLERDPGLHVRVLKVVNSAAFGLSHKVSNIRHAVNLLGRGRLEALVLSVATKNTLEAGGAAGLDMEQFWGTAARRAALARGLAPQLHPELQSDVFTIGLLQDMAVPLLAKREGERYRELYDRWRQADELSLVALEQRQCGIDHASLGARMARAWGFPETLVEGIGGHHHEQSLEVPLAVRIAALLKDDASAEDSAQLAALAAQRFGIDAEPLQGWIAAALAEGIELAEALH